MTFSIIGFDHDEGVIGSAVASKWPAVGGCVPFFRPSVGFINLQNHTYSRLAYDLLDEMEKGDDLAACAANALQRDTAPERRQCILASVNTGQLHAYSGDDNTGIYTHKLGQDCAAAGNTLVSKDVVYCMIDAFEDSRDQPLAERLILALEAGQAAGGDARGEQAVSVHVYHKDYPDQSLYPLNLRVDNSRTPLKELRVLYYEFGEHTRLFVV